MSAVDAPPGIAFAGQPSGEFVARPRARRLAVRMLWFVALTGAATMAVAARRIHQPFVEFVLVAPLMCGSIAFVGYAVRRARLRLDADGVRWGWGIAGVRMRPERLRRVRAYRDAIALTPKRGSTWYLSRHDWDRFERVLPALREARIGYEVEDRAAPLAARLQSYGIVLDGLLVLNSLIAAAALVGALLL